MPVLHHRVHILEVTDPAMRVHLKHARSIRRAIMMELDAAHWLVHDRQLAAVERACAKAGIMLTSRSHGD